MLGAIAGDIIGSVYEGEKQWLTARTADFRPLFSPRARFTDDTVLTIAVADRLLHGRDLTGLLKEYYDRYPGAGVGGEFKRWAASDDTEPYGSWGNGSAMRVSPVAWASDTLEEVLHRAKEAARVTHDHPDGIKGAQATAAAISWPAPGSLSGSYGTRSSGDSTTTCRSPSTTSARLSGSTPRVRAPCRRPSSPSWRRPTSNPPSGWRSRLAGTTPRWRRSRAASRRRTTACPVTSESKRWRGWTRHCRMSSRRSRADILRRPGRPDPAPYLNRPDRRPSPCTVGQFLRVHVCVYWLLAGGCAGALAVDSPRGARERARLGAERPDAVARGGVGVDIYMLGGFVLGVVPSAWALRHSEVVRWAFGPGRDNEDLGSADGPGNNIR